MNKKGFTLIELLAVIIILGILMIIAIPSVTKYISDSRKSTYVDTAKEIVSGTRNKVNEGKLQMYDTNATYYIPASYIKTENGTKSPYGEFTEAYVGVTFDGKGYSYYWISVDDSGQGVSNITPLDKLDNDDIESDLQDSDITNVVETTGIGDREKILILDPKTETWKEVVGGATNNVSEENGGGSNNSETIPPPIVCKPATTLHTATCYRTDAYGCNASGQAGNGHIITYGTLVSDSPKAGDAYDCKVTADGDFTERFYYVGSSGNKSILIYNKNMNGQAMYAYDSTGQNWHGPRTAYQYLPSTNEWNNPGILAPGTRNITNDKGTKTTDNGANVIDSFAYTNKAARFLTYQELVSACGNEWIDYEGYLNNCTWLMESLGQYENSTGAYGYWLENPHYGNNYDACLVRGYTRRVSFGESHITNSRGVRPVITILTASITN